MLQQAAHMALDIGLLVLPGVRSSKQMLDYDNAPTMERVRGITAWGISNFIMSVKSKRSYTTPKRRMFWLTGIQTNVDEAQKGYNSVATCIWGWYWRWPWFRLDTISPVESNRVCRKTGTLAPGPTRPCGFDCDHAADWEASTRQRAGVKFWSFDGQSRDAIQPAARVVIFLANCVASRKRTNFTASDSTVRQRTLGTPSQP